MNLNIYGHTSSNNLQDLENSIKANLEKLNQLKLMSGSQPSLPQQIQPVSQQDFAQPQQLQPQRYYLDCGIKDDWDEFLKLNYGITEKDIFDDYRLFLQAKQEILSEQGKSKLEDMKQRIKSNKSVITENTNVQPMEQPTNVQQSQPIVQQPVVQQSIQQQSQPIGPISHNINAVNGDIVQPIDGLLPTVQKQNSRQSKTKK